MKGLLHSISNVFPMTNITSNYAIKIIDIKYYVYVYTSARLFKKDSSLMPSHLFEIRFQKLIIILRARGVVLIRCFEKISLNPFYLFYFAVYSIYVNEIV